MIIVGYQGIGKSTLAGEDKFIDLESRNFWYNGKRPEDWYIYYTQIANHLSAQGFTVFVSPHEVVRNRLKEYSHEKVFLVFPSIGLKEQWIQRLEERYEKTKLEKDKKALLNAKDRYEENIKELKNCGMSFIEITDMRYSLKDLLKLVN